MSEQDNTPPEIPPAPLSPVERAYLEGIHKMGGMGRIQRMCSLHASMVRMLRHQIARQHPGLSERELRIRVAERMYMSDPGALKLLERARRQG